MIPDVGVVVHVSRGRVTVARDHIGVRPFHIARTGRAVLGASQLAGLPAVPSVRRIDVAPPGHVAVLGPDSVDIRPGSPLEETVGAFGELVARGATLRIGAARLSWVLPLEMPTTVE